MEPFWYRPIIRASFFFGYQGRRWIGTTQKIEFGSADPGRKHDHVERRPGSHTRQNTWENTGDLGSINRRACVHRIQDADAQTRPMARNGSNHLSETESSVPREKTD